jgi:hypothetical protein
MTSSRRQPGRSTRACFDAFTDAIPLLSILVLLGTIIRPASATDHVMAPGDPWPSAAEVAPGDRILLTPGIHQNVGPLRLSGTPERPIRIGSVDPTQPSALVGDAWGLDVQGGSNLEISTLMVISGASGAVRIRGTTDGPSRNVELRSILITPTPGILVPVGVDVEGVHDLRLLDLRVTRWQRAAIELRDTSKVSIARLTLQGDRQASTGIRMNEGVRNTRIEKSALLIIGGSGIAAGLPSSPPPDATTPTPAVNGLVIDGCIFERIAIPVTIGSAKDVRIERCTIVDPSAAVFELRRPAAPWATATEIRASGNLVTWKVNGLARLFLDDQPGATIDLGPNLWWAATMPTALDWLGGFPEGARPQVIEVDPRLVPRSYRPLRPEAMAFGHLATKDAGLPQDGDPPRSKREDAGRTP